MASFALGPFRLDARNDLLWHGTEPVTLGKRAIVLLRALVERPGELVSRDSLIEAAWSGQIVEDNNLIVHVAALRRVPGTAPDGGSWIETLPRRGYRFIALALNRHGRSRRSGLPSGASFPMRCCVPSAACRRTTCEPP
jgi:DNA-binding winged helix-turn-helix (wHTH) protein